MRTNPIFLAQQRLDGGPAVMHAAAHRLDRHLLELRAQNARHARIVRRLRAVYLLGERASVEFTVQLATQLGGLDLLDRLAERWAAADPEIVRAVGGDGFPPTPIRQIFGAGGEP